MPRQSDVFTPTVYNLKTPMPLAAGARIGPYEILAPLGAGGMGEVYSARDLKLNRGVAIKVLPAALAGDAQYMARFEREAQTLASLNHPNIATVYGVEQGALVMELVAGPTVADRIAQGAIPIDEALPIARQIAEGLEAAHERGVIHRDLKPANIKVTPGGAVKLLDFGLAKSAVDSAASAPAAGQSLSPTLSLAMTQAGMILGTAAYMSPEQARGKAVDKRADIWAFGVVLYEMLTGLPLFGGGDTVTDTLASVVKDAPDLSRLPSDTPPRIRRLIARCLVKDPRQRLRDIGEARILIDQEEETPPAPAARPAPSWGARWWIAAVPAVLVAIVLGFLLWRATRIADHPLIRFSAELSPDLIYDSFSTVTISPDGMRLVYPVRTAKGVQLATRLLADPVQMELPGTEDARQPFFSPDGQWIGFWANQKLRKISAHGGAAVTICDASALRGASWLPDGNIVFSPSANSPLSIVSSAGGEPRPVTNLADRHDATHRWPYAMPGGRTILFTSNSRLTGFQDGASICALDLATGRAKVVHRGGYNGRYVPSGHLVYMHQGTLFAVRLDTGKMETSGAPVPVLDDVADSVNTAGAQFDFSLTGMFVYMSGKTTASWILAWLDTAGSLKRLAATPAFLFTPRLSPDGRRLAYTRDEDLWVYDLERDTQQRLTFNRQTNRYATWSPDGAHLAFSSLGAVNGVWWVRSDGSATPEKLLETSGNIAPGAFTPDGGTLVYQEFVGNSWDIKTVTLDLHDPDHPKIGKPANFMDSDKSEMLPRLSADGHWLAYVSNEAGVEEIYVRAFPGGGQGASGKWQISSGGGNFPVWSDRTRELLFVAPDGTIMAAPYNTGATAFSAAKPHPWSAVSKATPRRPFEISVDGKRALILSSTEGVAEGQNPLHAGILLNFFDELRRRVP